MPLFGVRRFILLVTLGAGFVPGLLAQSLVLRSGDGQIIWEGFRTNSPLVVRAVDAGGRPMAGVPIDWSAPVLDGSLVGASSETDDEGLAEAFFVAGQVGSAFAVREAPVTASSPLGEVTFRMIMARRRTFAGKSAPLPLARILQPAASDPPFEGTPGDVIPGAVVVQVLVVAAPESGRPIPHVGVRIVHRDDLALPVPVSCNGPNGMVFTDEQGIAHCDLVLGNQTGDFPVAAYVGETTISFPFRVRIAAGSTGDGGGGNPAPAPLAFQTNPVLPPGRVGRAYTLVLSASGGTPPYQWKLSGSLPEGLVFDAANARLSGTPSSVTTAQFAVSLTDAVPSSVSRVFSLTIQPDNALPTGFSIQTTALPDGDAGAAYNGVITTAGGCVTAFNPVRLTVVGGAIPPGTEVTPFAVRGTPSLAGVFSFTIAATDNCGAEVRRSFTVRVRGAGGEVPPVQIAAEPGTLQFTVERDSAVAPAAQTVTVSSPQPVAFNVSTSTTTGGSWLRVDPANGLAPGAVSVALGDISLLDPGTYTAEIVIAPAAGTGTAVTVPVNLTITTRDLIVAPTTLRFTIRAGEPPPASQVISVNSLASGVPYQATVDTSSGGDWLFIFPTGTETPANLAVAANPVGLSPGTYDGEITVVRTDTEAEPITVRVTLEIPTPAPSISSVTNAASFLKGPVAPGEMLVVFGSNLGPRNLLPYQLTASGRLSDLLGGTRVHVDGFAAPLIYSWSTQVALIVPYRSAGRQSVKIQVEHDGVRSKTVEVPVQSAVPGIFTTSAEGQGAVLNQDGTVNSSNNPAARNSWISIFATGEGQTLPGGVDGSITPLSGMPRPLLPVAVQIDGLAAEVNYAGAAPALPSGVLQVNARIPEGVSGGAVPVVVLVGMYASQSGVTVYVQQ